jgi:hypothetical protein
MVRQPVEVGAGVVGDVEAERVGQHGSLDRPPPRAAVHHQVVRPLRRRVATRLVGCAHRKRHVACRLPPFVRVTQRRRHTRHCVPAASVHASILHRMRINRSAIRSTNPPSLLPPSLAVLLLSYLEIHTWNVDCTRDGASLKLIRLAHIHQHSPALRCCYLVACKIADRGHQTGRGGSHSHCGPAQPNKSPQHCD